MEFKINCSPHLKMYDISTKQLFNRNFHSDVQFSVQDKIIYAHSLELIKRSVIFEQELEDTMGVKKLITISDCTYESFLEFIRFIYTDECEITEDNCIEILKLATKYMIIKLENHVLSLRPYDLDWFLKGFEYCVCNKYELPRNLMKQVSTRYLGSYLGTKQFTSLHPDAVDEILKFEHIHKGVTELQIFAAIAEWISTQCKIHQISLSEGRQRWDTFIKKIRFPTMSDKDLRACYTIYPGLLTESDRTSIALAKRAIFDTTKNQNDLWINKAREIFKWPVYKRHFLQAEDYKTILFVSKDTYLQGLRIGIELVRKPIEIEILETDEQTDISQKLTFQQKAPDYWYELIISLGESLKLKPNFKYTISIKYLETFENLKMFCRNEKSDVIINDPGETVKLINASANMLEMFLKPAAD